MQYDLLTFRLHALQRMAQRGIDVDDVKALLSMGEVIESYPNDLPYPSSLMLGFCDTRPIHVVVAENAADREAIVITAYEPDRTRWDESFRNRRSP